MRKIDIRSFDFLRLLLVLGVLVSHGWFGWSKSISLLENNYRFGGFAVFQFFMLSGFLITYGLLAHLEQRPGKFEYFFRFYVKRICRIMPLYWLQVLVVLPALDSYFFQHGTILERIQIPNSVYTFTLNWDAAKGHWPQNDWGGVKVLWSLAVEEQFYLFWPIVVLIFRRKTEYVAYLLIAYSMWFSLGLNGNVIFLTARGSMLALCTGAVLAFKYEQIIRAEVSAWMLACGMLCAALILQSKLQPHTSNEYIGREIMAICVMLLCIMVFEPMLHAKRRVDCARFWRVMRHVGAMTYGVYILHSLCWFIASIFFGVSVKKCVLAFLLLIAVTMFSYLAYERWFIVLGSRLVRWQAMRRSGKDDEAHAEMA